MPSYAYHRGTVYNICTCGGVKIRLRAMGERKQKTFQFLGRFLRVAGTGFEPMTSGL
jgi:hypothetical protein